MLRKTITFNDYNNESRTENFFFNLSQAECMEMELSTSGGLQQLIDRITSEKDGKNIVNIFKDIILKSYGVKSPDGKYFRKSPEISKDFESTEAYSVLFMELATNPDAAAEFIRGVFPSTSELKQSVNVQNANNADH